MSVTKPQIQEAQSTPSRINAKTKTEKAHLGILYSNFRKSKIKKKSWKKTKGGKSPYRQADPINIKMIIKEYYEQLYAHKFDNLDEMVQFFEVHNLLKLT